MAIISDNAIDQEILTMKRFIEQLKITQATFANTFHSMVPKERARLILQIQNDHKKIAAFIEKAKKVEINNSGTKFALENIKQTYQTQMNLWRKTEKNLENFSAAAAATPKNAAKGPSETENAVEKYVSALRELGHPPDESSIHQFREKLDAAYNKAKSQAGGKEISIQVVQDGSKIKIRMEPK